VCLQRSAIASGHKAKKKIVSHKANVNATNLFKEQKNKLQKLNYEIYGRTNLGKVKSEIRFMGE
jgi:hypothetical protein